MFPATYAVPMVLQVFCWLAPIPADFADSAGSAVFAVFLQILLISAVSCCFHYFADVAVVFLLVLIPVDSNAFAGSADFTDSLGVTDFTDFNCFPQLSGFLDSANASSFC